MIGPMTVIVIVVLTILLGTVVVARKAAGGRYAKAGKGTKCDRCGHRNVPVAKFCAHCGLKLT